MLRGVDIYHHNENIDFNTLKDNVDFVIIKLGNIGDVQKFWLDSKFNEYYNECIKYNIPCGVYVYCYANSPENARLGGMQVADYIKNLELSLPVYIDIEDEELSNESKKTITDIIIAFNTEIEKTGNWAGFYCNRYWLNNKMDKVKLFDKYTNWIAIYPKEVDEEKYKGTYDIWQCSETMEVNGIDGKVDYNIMYRDIINQIGKHNYNKELDNDIYYPRCNKSYKSLVDALNSLGINTSFINRSIIANHNGVSRYLGTYSENDYLLELLKRGELKK